MLRGSVTCFHLNRGDEDSGLTLVFGPMLLWWGNDQKIDFVQDLDFLSCVEQTIRLGCLLCAASLGFVIVLEFLEVFVAVPEGAWKGTEKNHSFNINIEY